MNIVAQNTASKLFVAFVAVAMLFTFASPAKAATVEELQAQIAALMAQISSLSGGSSASAGACTFTRALTVGSEGADVKCLQDYLTPTYFTNAGGSTGYFGPVTASAVASWQSAHGVTPAAGYFGPVSQAKYNALMASNDDDSNTDDSDDNNSSTGDLSGEASLDTVEMADGDDADDVEEGSEDVEVAEITLEFADGDAMVTRIDLALDGTANTVNTESDPWDVFEDISLWVDGDEVARVDVSDEDAYLDEDNGSIRFSGLDIVGMEDEEVVIVVAASIASSIDDAGSSTLADWDVLLGPVRFTDADDVTTTETTGDSQAMDGSYSALTAAEFTIDEAGAGDSLDLETSSEDPEATTISLDEDNNVEEAIFAFELSAEDSDGDVDLNEIVIDVTVTTASNVDDLVNDFRIEIDGESFDAESYTGTGLSAALTFDINGDFTIAADEVATVVLFADFEDMESGDEGSTIFASTTPSDIDAEGSDDITVGGSAKVGETHTLRTEGLDLGAVLDGTGSSDSEQIVSGVATDANYGTMFLTYEITAFGDNLFVRANDAVRGASSTAGVAYTIEDSTGAATTTGAVSVSYDIEGADESNGFFELEDGETYEMTVTVNSYNPVGAGGTYNLQILTVGYAATAVNATATQAPDDLNDYESDAVAIQS